MSERLVMGLVGNPNCGKSALFNALTGLRQKVANYPGATVDRRIGALPLRDSVVDLIDLPGTYSLNAKSPDEEVTRAVLMGEQVGEKRPDMIICVVDATNLSQHLRFVIELKSLGLPMVVALNMMDLAKRDGIEIRVARPDENHALDVDHLASLIDDKTKLIAISHVPSSSGQINSVAEVGKIAKAAGVLYLLDACQAIGQLPVNVDAIGCDMFAGTSRKFLRGPRGVGFMYVSTKALGELDPVMMSNQSAMWTASNQMDVREDTRVFEAWERSVALQLGFGAALDYLLSIDTDAALERTIEMGAYLRQKLAEVNDVRIADPQGPLAAIVTFEMQGRDPVEVKAKLADKNIAVNVASVVHTRLDLEARGIESLLRASPQYYTLHEEIDRFVDAIASV